MASSRFRCCDFKFQVLWKEFAHEDGFVEKRGRPHALPDVGREMPCSLQDPFAVIRRHFCVGISRRRSLSRLLDIHEAYFSVLLLSDSEQNSKSQKPQRTASFHPVSGIEKLHWGVVVAGTQHRREAVHMSDLEQFLDRLLFRCGNRPEALSQGNAWLVCLRCALLQVVSTSCSQPPPSPDEPRSADPWPPPRRHFRRTTTHILRRAVRPSWLW